MELDVLVQVAGVASAGAFVIRSVQVVIRRAFGRGSTIEQALGVCERIVDGCTAAELERERRETLRIAAATLRPGGRLVERRPDGSSIEIRYESPEREVSYKSAIIPDSDSETGKGRRRRPPSGPPPKAA